MKWTTCNNYSVLVGKNESLLFCCLVLIFYAYILLCWSSFFTAPTNFWCFCPGDFVKRFVLFIQTLETNYLGCLRWANEVKRPWIIQCEYLYALGQNVAKIMQTIFSAKRKIRLYKETCNFLFDLKRLKLRLGGFLFQG